MQLTVDDGMRERLFLNLRVAHIRAAEDAVQDIQDHQARRSGRLADSYHPVANPWTPKDKLSRVVIVSDAIYANAVEHGANTREAASVKKGTRRRALYETVDGKRRKVGYAEGPLLARRTRRGPHMKGNHVVLDHGSGFLEHMGFRLYEANGR